MVDDKIIIWPENKSEKNIVFASNTSLISKELLEKVQLKIKSAQNMNSID